MVDDHICGWPMAKHATDFFSQGGAPVRAHRSVGLIQRQPHRHEEAANAELSLVVDAGAMNGKSKSIVERLESQSIQPALFISRSGRQPVLRCQFVNRNLHVVSSQPMRLSPPRRLPPMTVPGSGRPRIEPRPRVVPPNCNWLKPPLRPMIEVNSTCSPRPRRMPAATVHTSTSVCAGRCNSRI